MKTKSFALTGFMLFLCSIFTVSAQQTNMTTYGISEPLTYKNLTVFFVSGESDIAYNDYLTLEEAMKNGDIKVYETGQVSELQIENLSDKPVFIQAGDIVKGGKQDRVIQIDIIIRKKYGKVPLASFCVEHGRWSRRGGEELAEFSVSEKRIASKDLKMAAYSSSSQQDVWEEVEVVQDKLAVNMDVEVRDGRSSSSLQLTLENKELEKRSKNYQAFFNKALAGRENVLGMVFAINGEINSADIYNNAILFKKLWPKLIDACATEAIAEYDEGTEEKELSKADISTWLLQAGNSPQKDIKTGSYLKLKVRESKEDFLIETYDAEKEDNCIHKNMIRK